MATEKLRYVISVEGGREFKQQMKSARQTTETESKGIIGNFKNIAMTARVFVAGAVAAAAAKAATSMIDLAEKTRVVGASYERLTASIGQNSEMILRSMRRGVGGAVADLELMRQANQAILLGIPVTASQMEKLAQTALRLGRAVGRDATDALGDLITGIGRMSPLILDNLGITIKAEEAFRNLGKGATDAEKRVAFFNAVMLKAEERSKTLGDIQPSVGEKMDILAAKTKNLAAAIGETLAGAALTGIGWLERLGEAIAAVNSGGAANRTAERIRLRNVVRGGEGEIGAQSFGPRFSKVGSTSKMRERFVGTTPEELQLQASVDGAGEIAPLTSGQAWLERNKDGITELKEHAVDMMVDVPDQMQMGFEDAFRYIQGQFAFLGATGRGIFGGLAGVTGGLGALGIGGSGLSSSLMKLTGQIGAVGGVISGALALGSALRTPSFEEQIRGKSPEELREILRSYDDIEGSPLAGDLSGHRKQVEAEILRQRQTGSQTVNRTIQTLTDESFRVYAGEFSALHALHKQYMPYLEEIAMNTRGGGGGEGAALMVDKSKRAGGF